jgi:hypothetical protein
MSALDKAAALLCAAFGHRWEVSPWREHHPVVAGLTHTREIVCLRCPERVTEPHYGATGVTPDEGP